MAGKEIVNNSSISRLYTEQQHTSVEEVISKHLALVDKFEEPAKIKLELISQTPEEQENVSGRDIAISTAIQCYAPGIALMRPRRKEREIAIAESTLDAGHLTTRQHQSITWKLAGISRSVTHDLLHANPFYNSEQQSQRYVEARKGGYIVPAELTERQRCVYERAASFANEAYFELLEVLQPEVSARINKMYPPEGWSVKNTSDRLQLKGKKISQEIARYALPIGQKTTFDHTLSPLQLIRLFKASQMPHVTDEGRYVVAKMIKELAEHDPSILDELRLPVDTRIYGGHDQAKNIVAQKVEFDTKLGDRQSVFVNGNEVMRVILADAIRNILGRPSTELSDKEALNLLLDPRNNRLLADVFDTGMIDPITSSLRQVDLQFMTKLSHTADSQRQRHRRTPGATPAITQTYDGYPDYMTPMVINETPGLKEMYDKVMQRMYENIAKAIKSGVPIVSALLLLPNAHNIRVIEKGDLFDWQHRWRQRLCLLAQEEICFISVEQVQQVQEIIPEATRTLRAPCTIRQRAQVKPRCPEGDRWCGQPVWNWNIDEYREGRLI